MLASINSVGIFGLDSYMVSVETDISTGMPVYEIVGLPDVAVKESRDRVRTAVKNCGFDMPIGRIIVNLAPADKKKAGSIYDLPVLLSLLLASKQINVDVTNACFVGELSLRGEVRATIGVLPMAIEAKKSGMEHFFVPFENAPEGSAVEGLCVYPVKNVIELIDHLSGGVQIEPVKTENYEPEAFGLMPDFSEVKGQQNARRAMEIAAAGGHNALLIGPPGAGKSMIAKRLSGILPEMTFDESIETTKLYSIAGAMPHGVPLIKYRPYRSPHHTVSPAGLSGGGSIPKPGEISLAHNGVLFLDELPEFSRQAMEILRQPIEDGTVTISRVNGRLTYPCAVMLIAAMNPCPCGFFGHPTKPCTCPKGAVSRYLSRVSGPLLDRLDLHIEVMPVEFEHLSSTEKSESSAVIRQRVNKARELQTERYKSLGITCNARLTPSEIQNYCQMTDRAIKILKNSFDKLGLSARAYDKLLKVSRTIADLEKSEIIEAEHIAEAVQYRSLDRKYWQYI